MTLSFDNFLSISSRKKKNIQLKNKHNGATEQIFSSWYVTPIVDPLFYRAVPLIG